MNDKPRIDFGKRATAPLPPSAVTAAKPISETYEEGAKLVPEPEQLDTLAAVNARLAKLEKTFGIFVEWFEAAGAAETLHVRDGFGTKTHLAACARRDALRIKVAELIRE